MRPIHRPTISFPSISPRRRRIMRHKWFVSSGDRAVSGSDLVGVVGGPRFFEHANVELQARNGQGRYFRSVFAISCAEQRARETLISVAIELCAI
jgi:hypothetical protein